MKLSAQCWAGERREKENNENKGRCGTGGTGSSWDMGDLLCQLQTCELYLEGNVEPLQVFSKQQGTSPLWSSSPKPITQI